MISFAIFVQRWPSFSSERRSRSRITPHSSGSSFGSNSGTLPSASNSRPLWMSNVASPPSSTICCGPEPSGQTSASSVHHQYSSSVSPFQAKTGTPWGSSGEPFGPTTVAAAAESWVEKMLHETQRTSAPSSTSVSISTAVCTVMCRLPMMRRPSSGFFWPKRSRSAIRPGISCSARRISLRPSSCRDRSATLKGRRPSLASIIAVVSWVGCVLRRGRRRSNSSG